ncbi:hypothetical protein DX927_20275 [Bacillus swezeyi]|uniref:Uncharacterized protein n=1 Tax=Bacillus swezeyi TaxID=1925020 RepID=A0A5M8RJC7_9BACI|nr:hypothetical protein DX927_20275 [Bacillus swezeyi]
MQSAAQLEQINAIANITVTVRNLVDPFHHSLFSDIPDIVWHPEPSVPYIEFSLHAAPIFISYSSSTAPICRPIRAFATFKGDCGANVQPVHCCNKGFIFFHITQLEY